MKTSIPKILSQALIAMALLLVVNARASAQANYDGGRGGGYATMVVALTTHVSLLDTLSNKSFDAAIYPNPLKKGEPLKFRLRNEDMANKTIVVVSDALGNRVHSIEIDRSIVESEVLLPFEKMARGIYLITFQNGKSRVTRKITLQE